MGAILPPSSKPVAPALNQQSAQQAAPASSVPVGLSSESSFTPTFLGPPTQSSGPSSNSDLLSMLLQLLQRLMSGSGNQSSCPAPAPTTASSSPATPPPAQPASSCPPAPATNSTPATGSSAPASSESSLAPIINSGTLVINPDGTYSGDGQSGTVNGNPIINSGTLDIHGQPNLGAIINSGTLNAG